MAEHLVLCGGVKRREPPSTLKLGLSGFSKNITLRIDDISKKLVRNIPDLLVDLVEIATYVFCADQAVGRGSKTQRGMGREWRRDFRFVIPVRNASHWNRRDVSESLCLALSFLSEDNYTFEFKKAAQPVPFQSYLEFENGNGAKFNTDEVVLFSGGLDSLSGAIEALSKSGSRIALVSHRSSPKIFEHQKRLVEELKRRFPGRVMYIPVLATRQAPLEVREHTQRTRSFLYSALACVVAWLFGNNRIRFFENGVVSINLPISEQVVGARATRTTHPLVLHHFENVFSAALEKPVAVENPFIWKTKPDVIRSIVDHDCGELIKDTISCTRTYDITKLHTHCGCCSQCLDRRFAILAANAGKHDPAEMYKVDLLTGPRDRPNDQTMAESYVRMALELREGGEQAFFSRFGGETARVCAGFSSIKPDDIARQVFDLHQRHGEEIRNVLKGAIEGHSDELINRELPPTAILMMTITPGGGLPKGSAAESSDTVEKSIEDAEEVTTPGILNGALSLGRTLKGRGKSRLALERAQGVIKELYPDGIPSQAVEPNVRLCRRVGDKLKEAGLSEVSDDTILRAAGRRK